ncbi:hypothetical protein EYR41_000265 [Orbilia oligospora]|uniref:Uncharacterized protein n=1 Tax=Orbilia oligospora TaxID=2813651 RepID=A0A8H2E7G4_ORBOL|nr:hypothetical protein EYR41_000265 [Orbilia oligospora]
MASNIPSNKPVSVLLAEAFRIPQYAQDEEPAPTPINTSLFTESQINSLRARARIMSYELQPPFQAPEAPHVTDINLANLRFNRLTLAGTLSIYIEKFPGDTPEDLLTTFGVHAENNNIPDICILSHILELLLKETEWIEINILGNDPLQLRNFKREENSKMGREIRSLRALVESYTQIKEELRQKHGIIMAPIKLPAHFDEFYGDDDDYDEMDDEFQGEEYDDDENVDEDEELTEHNHDEQSTKSSLGHVSLESPQGQQSYEPFLDQVSLESPQDQESSDSSLDQISLESPQYQESSEFSEEVFYDAESSSESSNESEKSENIKVNQLKARKTRIPIKTQDTKVNQLKARKTRIPIKTQDIKVNQLKSRKNEISIKTQDVDDKPLLEPIDNADTVEEANDEPLPKSIEKTGIFEEAPNLLQQRERAESNFKLFPHIVTLAIGIAIGVGFNFLLK